MSDRLEMKKYIQRKRYQSAIKYASNIANDPQFTIRRGENECVLCFYSVPICGQAFTKYDCKMCGKEETHSNTCTPKICRDCSIEYSMCRNCEGNLEI